MNTFDKRDEYTHTDIMNFLNGVASHCCCQCSGNENYDCADCKYNTDDYRAVMGCWYLTVEEDLLHWYWLKEKREVSE